MNREDLNKKQLKKIRRKVSTWNSGIKGRGNSDFRVSIDWALKYDTCTYCGINLVVNIMSLDHKVPRSQGGTDKEENLIICCKSCNLAKSSMSEAEFRALLKLLSQPPFTERVKKLIIAKLKYAYIIDIKSKS